MTPLKIAEAKGGSVQLSEGKYFLMTQKFLCKKGFSAGKPIYTIKLSELKTDPETPDKAVFFAVKTFLVNPKDFDAWLALLIQLSERKVEGDPIAEQRKL